MVLCVVASGVKEGQGSSCHRARSGLVRVAEAGKQVGQLLPVRESYAENELKMRTRGGVIIENSGAVFRGEGGAL